MWPKQASLQPHQVHSTVEIRDLMTIEPSRLQIESRVVS